MKDTRAILFDWGGTLIDRLKPKNNGLEYYGKMLDILESKEDPNEFRLKIKERYKVYKNWGLEYALEAPEEVILCKWLLPEYPVHLILKHTNDLTVLFSNAMGPRVLKNGVEETLIQLEKSGYKLGVISNNPSRTIVPDEIKHFGLDRYFRCKIVSALEGIRKPDIRMFLKASYMLGERPEHCVYIGDQPNRDVLGAKTSGYSGVVIIQSDVTSSLEGLEGLMKPDHVICEIKELAAIFPDRSGNR